MVMIVFPSFSVTTLTFPEVYIVRFTPFTVVIFWVPPAITSSTILGGTLRPGPDAPIGAPSPLGCIRSTA